MQLHDELWTTVRRPDLSGELHCEVYCVVSCGRRLLRLEHKGWRVGKNHVGQAGHKGEGLCRDMAWTDGTQCAGQSGHKRRE